MVDVTTPPIPGYRAATMPGRARCAVVRRLCARRPARNRAEQETVDRSASAPAEHAAVDAEALRVAHVPRAQMTSQHVEGGIGFGDVCALELVEIAHGVGQGLAELAVGVHELRPVRWSRAVGPLPESGGACAHAAHGGADAALWL